MVRCGISQGIEKMNLHDLMVAILVTFFFVLLAIPYQFEFSYWAETPFLWIMYFLVGAALIVYIFYIFLQEWRYLIQEGEDKL